MQFEGITSIVLQLEIPTASPEVPALWSVCAPCIQETWNTECMTSWKNVLKHHQSGTKKASVECCGNWPPWLWFSRRDSLTEKWSRETQVGTGTAEDLFTPNIPEILIYIIDYIFNEFRESAIKGINFSQTALSISIICT